MSPAVRAHASLAAVVAVWAGAFSAIKVLLDHGVPATDVALFRYLVAAPGFALLLWRSGGLPGLDRRDAVRVVLAGVLVVAVYHVSLNAGTRFTTSGTAALIVALAPGMTLVFAVAAGLERLVALRVVGLATAFAGVAVVVLLGSGEEVSLANVKGPLIVLGAPASFALYNVLLKPLFARYGVLALTAATSLIGTLALAPLAGGGTADAVAEASSGDVVLVLYLGLACTLFAYVGWNVGLRRVAASRAVAYLYGVPVLALAIGALVLDEPVTAWLALGGALVVAGVALAQSARA